MNAVGSVAVVSPGTRCDAELVAAVRAGDDDAFEELYRRYQRRISAFLRGLTRDDARTEDVAQEVFLSALRRLRATDAPIVFKPWIYEIARNAAIDAHRRGSRAEELPIDETAQLRPSDRRRLVGLRAPDAELMAKESLEHLSGAFAELSETHHRILVLRELEGLSYREIGERMELTRPAVESTLFRARRKLEHEYEEIDTGRRCEAMRALIAAMAEGVVSDTATRRLARHARRCGACRRRAQELGVHVERCKGLGARAAALLPLPALLRRSGSDAGTISTGAASVGASAAGPLAHKAAALLTAAALAGAGEAALEGPAGRDARPLVTPPATLDFDGPALNDAPRHLRDGSAFRAPRRSAEGASRPARGVRSLGGRSGKPAAVAPPRAPKPVAPRPLGLPPAVKPPPLPTTGLSSGSGGTSASSPVPVADISIEIKIEPLQAPKPGAAGGGWKLPVGVGAISG